jgi:hypothetical protein
VSPPQDGSLLHAARIPLPHLDGTHADMVAVSRGGAVAALSMASALPAAVGGGAGGGVRVQAVLDVETGRVVQELRSGR